jgi:tetratricopeptide (TPR) repeat protein
MRSLRAACLVLLIAVGAARAVAAQDPADAAWNRGDLEDARRLYAERVAADSSDVRALHRLALLFAWNREFPPSLALFDRLLVVTPDNLEAQVDRARVLSWSGRYGESVQAYDAVLARNPHDRRAQVGLAQVLAWSGRLDSAAVVYRQLLEDDPDDLEARQGLARVAAWRGDLRGAESEWRRALEAGGDDAATLIGLSQTLRWQGRLDEALRLLERVPEERRTEREYLDERAWVDAGLSAAVAPSVTYETDSDANDIWTIGFRGSYPVAPRVRVGLDAYFRTATWDVQLTGARRAWGASATGRYVLDPGWALDAALGLSTSNGAEATAEPSIRLGVTSPAGNPVAGSLSFSRSAFDATALLMERGVTYAEIAAGVRAKPAYRWEIDGAVAYASFSGSESNRRILGRVAGSRTITPAWTAVARVRTFGFQKDLNDGYFDPDFYFLGELLARWRPLRGPSWHITAEVAPGLEQITSSWNPHATAFVHLEATRQLGPGRQLALGAVYTNAGLQSFATGETGYRYFAITLSGGWAF